MSKSTYLHQKLHNVLWVKQISQEKSRGGGFEEGLGLRSAINGTTVAVVTLTVAVAAVRGTRWRFVLLLVLLLIVVCRLVEVLEPVQVLRLCHSEAVGGSVI